MIRLENVTKSYKGTTVALRDCSVDITKGEFVFLVGPSGSGKSTFLRLLTKEEEPDSGTIWVAGKDIGKLSTWKVPFPRRNIGCVFQDFKLLPNKTVYENVAFELQVIGRPKHVIKSQVPQILDLVGLAKKMDNLPTELSGGEQQRVSIARAFVNRPLILLADEPTGNLDPNTTIGIMRLLDRINRTGTTVVMATHDQGIVDSMRRRVIELDRGTVVRDQPNVVDTLTVDASTPSCRVVPTRAELVDTIGRRFKDQPGVSDVVYAKDAIKALVKRSNQLKLGYLVFSVVFLLAALVLIFTTIQLAIFSRRREIGVMKLVGATNWFIRVPFMAEGMFQGLVGAVLACGFVWVSRNFWVSLASDAGFTQLNKLFVTTHETVMTSVVLLLLGAIAGALGSAVAVRRFLDV